MEIFGLLYIPLWSVIGLTVCCLYYAYSTKSFSVFPQLGLSGPRPWPVLGNIHELMAKGFVDAYQDWYKENGRVFGTHEGLNPVLVVGDLEMMKEIMVKQFNNFPNRPDFGLFRIERPPITELLNLMRDEDWRHTRSVLTPTLTSGKLRKMTADVLHAAKSTVKALEQHLADGRPAEIKKYMSSYTMDVISATAFGLHVDSQNNPEDPFVKYAEKLFAINFSNPVFLAMFLCPFILPLLKLLGFRLAPGDTVAFFRRIVDEAIRERRANPGKHSDFLQLMVNAKEMATSNTDEGDLGELNPEPRQKVTNQPFKGLTDSQILGSSIVFFGAGFDTTASTLTHALYHLSLNPQHMERLIREVDEHFPAGKLPDYESTENLPFLKMVIMETLRINPPLGRFTPEKRRLHHPLQWIPFGHGPRGCIGMRLAMMEIKILMVLLFQKFRFIPNSKTMPLKFGSTLVLSNSVHGVWLTVESRVRPGETEQS